MSKDYIGQATVNIGTAEEKNRNPDFTASGGEDTNITETMKELEFLRYFYEAAGEAFGPADSDIYASIAESFKSAHGWLPADYDS